MPLDDSELAQDSFQGFSGTNCPRAPQASQGLSEAV
jgi:hypothetical protein